MRDPWTICLVFTVFWAISTLPSGSQVQAQTCAETAWFGDNCQSKCQCTANDCTPDGVCNPGHNCVTGWFGDKCQYKCHCTDDNCDQDGNCVTGSKCDKGWFGPQCQYVDLTTTEASASYPDWLYDGDNMTCNQNPSLSTVTVTFGKPLPFTWLRIHIKEEVQLSPPVVQFRAVPNQGAFIACSERRTAIVDKTTLDIHCNLSTAVQEVFVSGQSVESLCSLFISGGRNVALKESTSQSTTFLEKTSDRAVDGNTDGQWNHDSCTDTGFGSSRAPSTWQVEFTQTRNVNRYVLYNRIDSVRERLLKFLLKSYDQTNSETFSYQDQQSEPQNVYTVTSVTPTSPTHRVEITATYKRGPDPSVSLTDRGDSGPVLTLCEVEIYGDSACPAKSYGRECEGTCNCVDSTENCFVSTGGCSSGCPAGFHGEACDVACDLGWYGPNCAQECSKGCANNCNKTTGNCIGGCKGGYTGNKCEACIDGRYGTECDQMCSRGCSGTTCDKESGSCVGGCKTGFKGSKCEECVDGKYGMNCDLSCPSNCNTTQCDRQNGYCTGCLNGHWGNSCKNDCSNNCTSNTCDKQDGRCSNGCVTGHKGAYCNLLCTGFCKDSVCKQYGEECSTGCIDGYIPLYCTQICFSGNYGPGCSLPCPENCKTGVCHHVNGNCTDGCKAGFSGAQCTSKCSKGKYGPGCGLTCSPNCEGGECDSDNGHCTLGCKDVYTGDMCNVVCNTSTYGEGCLNNCSNTCKDRDCHPRLGHCYECSDGYTNGPGDNMCTNACENGKYGPGCTVDCSVNCFKNESDTTVRLCNNTNGFCMLGCVKGYNGHLCTESDSSDSDILLAAAIGGAAAAVLIIIIIIVVVCLCRRRKRGKDERSYMAENRVIEGREAKKENGTVFMDPESPILPESANKTQATPPSAKAVDEEDGTPNFNVNDATVVSTAVTTAALAPKLLPKPKLTPKEKPKLKPKPPAKPNKLALMLKGKGGKAKKSPYYNTMISQSKTAIAVEELDSFMASKTKDFFQDQFKSIPNNESATTKDAQSDENRAKNRYKNICAYDHSRVHLKINTDKHQGDYINASYIDGYKGDEKFIASQGPMAINMEDFARMLWEQKVEKVVMLTNLVEDGKVKCERYWPEEEEELEFGDIKISLLTTQVFADYTIRRIQLYNGGEEARTVTHYHFTSWPDKDVPTTPWGLVDFEQRVAAQATDKPIVVHCSAGVGRTGTFIALRNVMRQAEDTGYVDFFTTVGLQRENRVNMVQTAAQYEFLHRAAYIAIVCMGTTVTGGAIQERIAALEERSEGGKTFMEKEFKAVCAVCEEANDSGDEDDGDEVSNVYQNSRSVVNKMKNRVANILPKEYYRVRLMCTDGATEDYINAVFTPSFKRQDQQILTQDPLPTTVTDFWRMVTQYKVSLIVAFDVDTKDVDKTIGDYLPDEETEEPLDLSLCSVYVTSSTSEEFWEEQKISVTTTGKWKEKLEASGKQVEGSQQVTHVTCLTTDLDAANLLTFIKHIRSLRSDGEGRTVYMCRNGADYSGLVCVLSLLLDRLDSDHHLTVPLVVGAIKAIRPQVIPNLEQYKLLYQVLKIYNESNNVYCNFK